MFELLRELTVTDLLHPQNAVTHEVQWEEIRVIWFRSMLWGQAYVSSIHAYGPWYGTNVKLFQIIQQQPSQQPSQQQQQQQQ